ncbi:olfactory receptor 5V1-like [Terrapene carolina triunguis]|uniref:olfactory receptor 5V1-like n=1 Tax=Terrapene triunguis TaxID=2587831 RepID=UPI000E774670|nr:olfactory receptor 5V1-like [Terrapene carolina triunguis]
MEYVKGSAGGNHTVRTKFILLGFSNLPRQKYLLFSVFLSAYLITLAGNLLIIVLTLADPALHIPMYFFLRNLSFLEICYTSVNIPKILANLLSEDQTISFIGCAVQTFFFFFLAGSECFLLASMGYDRYVAICKPLYYSVVMSRKVYTGLAAGSWLSGLLIFFGLTVMVFTLPFCHSHEINHFFCDIPPLLKLACGDTSGKEMSVFIMALFVVTFPFMLILMSYVCIISTILRMPSGEGRRKSFSTCSSHLLVVMLSYGSASVMYLKPKSSYSPDTDKFLSLSYSVITPMLNPIIYCLRNKEVRGAFWRMMGRRRFC